MLNSSSTGSKSWTSAVARPTSFTRPFALKDKLLMIPGPSNISHHVLQAMCTPILGLTDPQFYRLLSELQSGIRYLFQTTNRYTFAMTGAGTCGMEATLANLLLPGQRLLTLTSGHWGERVAMMGERLSLDVVRLKPTSLAAVYSVEQLEEAVARHRPTLLYVCHGDSSLGTLQPLEGIGRLCHRYGCTLMVDAVVSMCSAPLPMDALDIDVLYSAPQKALSGPPGLSLISLSERAVALYRARSAVQQVPSFYQDIGLVAKAWGTDNGGVYQYHYTHATNLLFGLRAAIEDVVSEGLESVVERHANVKSVLEQALQDELRLQLLVPQAEHRLPGIVAVLIPEDIDGVKVISYLYEKHDILISGSLIPASSTVPRFWRIGYLGVNANLVAVGRLVTALKEALADQRKLKSHL